MSRFSQPAFYTLALQTRVFSNWQVYWILPRVERQGSLLMIDTPMLVSLLMRRLGIQSAASCKCWTSAWDAEVTSSLKTVRPGMCRYPYTVCCASDRVSPSVIDRWMHARQVLADCYATDPKKSTASDCATHSRTDGWCCCLSLSDSASLSADPWGCNQVADPNILLLPRHHDYLDERGTRLLSSSRGRQISLACHQPWLCR